MNFWKMCVQVTKSLRARLADARFFFVKIVKPLADYVADWKNSWISTAVCAKTDRLVALVKLLATQRRAGGQAGSGAGGLFGKADL